MAIHTDAYVLRVSRGGVFFDKMPNSEVSWAGVFAEEGRRGGKTFEHCLGRTHTHTQTQLHIVPFLEHEMNFL